MARAEERVSLRINSSIEYTPAHVEVLCREIRTLFEQLGASPRAPLAGIVRPGDTVVLKPNLVFDKVSDPRAALTHGRFVKAVCDLVLEALGDRGRVVIADVPLQGAQFAEVIRSNSLDEVMADYKRCRAPVELLDLRQEYMHVENGVYRGIRKLAGDPLGYQVVNLGSGSELEGLGAYRSRFAVGDYDRDSTARYHMSSERNEYLIPRTILAADVLINLPKLKTHKKAGITCALKNLVGICGHKSYLPHFREGGPEDGGDEFAINHPIKRVQRNAIDRLKTSNALVYGVARSIGRLVLRLATAREAPDLRKVMSGSWYGNDTLWRTIIDLNKIIRYADKSGTMQNTPQRRYACIVDGVYSGEGDGPIVPDVRHDGILLAGGNAVLIDLVACLLMGVDPAGIQQVRRAFDVLRYPIVSKGFEYYRDNPHDFIRSDRWPLPNLLYRLPPAWEGHVPRLCEPVTYTAPAGPGSTDRPSAS